jgi:ribonuclease HI
MKKVTIYTDGACSGNPGPGGWGAILMYNGTSKEISGANKNTTNNIMEITAVLEALKLLKEECEVKIYSDSAYVVNAFNQGWIYNWKKNNWKTASKDPVKNQELWEELYSLVQKHKVEFIKVKGHSDNEYNNRCDFLATSAIKKL